MNRIAIIAMGLSAATALLVAGCTPSTPTHPTMTAPQGTQILAEFGAVGNSLTAGFMDGGLIVDGQMASIPRLLAQQFGLDVSTTSEAFTQPYVAPPGIGSTNVGPDLVAGVLFWDEANTTIGVLGVTPEASVQDLLLASAVPVPYHNLGVPGGWMQDVTGAINSTTTESGSANPYFDFILRNQPAAEPFMANASQLQQGVAKGPSIFMLWTGSNNILGPALGGEIDETTGAPMTSVQDFNIGFVTLLRTFIGGFQARTGFNTSIIVANLFDDLPYFIPRALFELAIGGGYPPGYAEGDPADINRVLFPALTWVQDPDNLGDPIPETLTLTTGEFGKITEFLDAYNDIIETEVDLQIASGSPVALADVNAEQDTWTAEQQTHFIFLLNPPANLTVEQAAQTTLFSLDAIHLNSRGYGKVANVFIAAVNGLTGNSVADVAWESIVWDPTYAAYQPPGKAGVGGGPLTAEATEVLRNLIPR